MKLPRGSDATVDDSKLDDYLLSSESERGRHKAALFARFGFTRDLLKQVLLRAAEIEEVESQSETQYGRKFTIHSSVESPVEPELIIRLRSVWQIDLGESRPRLITALIEKD